MELLVVLILLAAGVIIYSIYDSKKSASTDTLASEAPYKIEPPVTEVQLPVVEVQPPVCGCGRSPSGFCVGLHKLSDSEWSVHADNPNAVTPAATLPVIEPVVVTDTIATVEVKKPRAPRAKKPETIKVKGATADKAAKRKKKV